MPSTCSRWILAIVVLAVAAPESAAESDPEARALAFLAREVPRWRPENGCYSCHNNGDAARALIEARRLGADVPEAALADTLAWLARPEAWDDNGGDGPFSDKPLARLQFTVALAAAVESGVVSDRAPLLRAAARLAEDQAGDGSWPVEADGQLGSPATYGRPLATWLAREALADADAERFGPVLARADRWLGRLEPRSLLDAAVIVLADGTAAGDDASRRSRVAAALGRIREGQAPSGGWGPHADAFPEVFDTAIVLLALARHEDPGDRERIRRGRAFLIAGMGDDGSWIETTRPSGSESYAQRLSTTGWATLALLATRPATPAPP